MTHASEIVIPQEPEPAPQEKPTFVERLTSAALESEGIPTSGIIPFQEYALYLDIVAEAIAHCLRDTTGNLVILADAHTAGHFSAFEGLVQSASHVVIWGGNDTPFPSNVSVLSYDDTIRQGSHLFSAVSPELAVVVAGAIETSFVSGESLFRGGWCLEFGFADKLMSALLSGIGCLDGIPDREIGWRPGQTMLAMNLMGRYSNYLAVRQHDMAQDKDDLFSVLDILKAISSKRRAHDILYVFVEQIARVVSSDRCSVVRIWGSSDQGSVMASHEDVNLSGQTIDLSKYPELREAVATEEKVVINDVSTHPLTASLGEAITNAGFHSLLVIPIVVADQNVGTLLLRAARREGVFSPREIGFFEIVSEAAANALERAQLFESIQIANERLERLAITDGLTGLHNHRHFREQLEQELDRAVRYEQPLSCMLLDVDDFKNFNDTYGHLAGDEVLREMAKRIQQCVRRTDVVARYGGEEFVVIMPQTDLRGGMIQAQRICEHIGEEPFVLTVGALKATVSIGVSALDHQYLASAEDIIRQADQALYRAKREGKNRVLGPKNTEQENSP